ncbi:MAG TPA: hypothetical protein PKY82_29815 [Pyrinomonadaceae bacterium]|nr:hypothetical protein [Pyrinomonadaceae bacterium]
MKSGVLEFRPKEIPQINNPLNNLFIALTDYIESVVERRINERLEVQPGNPEPKPLKLLKAKEVAAIIGCAETTINDKADGGLIPCRKWSKGKKTFRRFDLTEVLAALESKN